MSRRSVAKGGKAVYGAAVGIVMLEARFPRIPGDVGNAATWPFPVLYKVIRHPIMVGFLIAFWAVPDMSVGRLLFAGAASAYIVVGVRLEEHDLKRELGEPYERYLERTPRFVPGIKGKVTGASTTARQ